MAKTPSNMVSLGTKAPNFNLLDVTSNSFKTLDELKGDKGTVIMFICNHDTHTLTHTLAHTHTDTHTH